MSSGKFVFRTEPELHRQAKSTAKQEGISLNEYCNLRLAQPLISTRKIPFEVGRAVQYAHDLCGAYFIGAVLYGSWIRDQIRDDSDIDLLVVVDEGFQFRRSLYSNWLSKNFEHKGHVISAQFAKLPDPNERVGGIWAEIAIEGLILEDPDFRISQCLAHIRRKIACGELIRKTLHGQPYWIHRKVA